VTDDLVSMFCRVLQIDEDSALFQAVRGLVRAWRDENYVAYRQAGLPTQNQYLLDFDVSYRLRRIRFVLNKVDDLARAEDALEVRQEFQQIKKGILRNYQRLRRLERRLWPSRIDDSPLRAFTTNLGITVKDLEGFVVRTGELGTGRGNETNPCRPPGEHPISEDECMKRAAEFLHAHPDQKQELDRAAAGLRELLRTVWLAPEAGEGLERLTLADGSPTALRARGVVRHYFDQYERYDLVLYPILFQSDVIGEGATVDVIRLSPEDATCLMVDRAEARLASPRPKLAGLTLGHFGGFVEAEWRRNDMMWGRLDAVERLITTILPDGKDEQARLALIDQAQRMVIREELSDEQRRKLYEKISEHGPSGDSLEYAKRILLDEKEALKDYRETLDRKPQPEGAARALARGTQVVGKMLEGIARKREIDTKRIAILTRMGRLLWGLVEVAVPRRLPELLFHKDYHRGFSHSLLAAILVSLTLAWTWKIAGTFWRSFGIFFAAYGSHLAIDFFTGVQLGWNHSGSGIPLFWPWPGNDLSSQLILIYGVTHGSVSAIFSVANLHAICYDLVFFGSITTALLLWRTQYILNNRNMGQ